MIRRSIQRKGMRRSRTIACALKEFEDIKPDENVGINPPECRHYNATNRLGNRSGVDFAGYRNTRRSSSSNTSLQARRSRRFQYATYITYCRTFSGYRAGFLPLTEINTNSNSPECGVKVNDTEQDAAVKPPDDSSSASPTSSSPHMQASLDRMPLVTLDANSEHKGDQVDSEHATEGNDYWHYVNVHKLIDSVVPTGCTLPETGGYKSADSASYVTANIRNGVNETPPSSSLRNSVNLNHTDPAVSCPEKSELVSSKHPFLHLWEYDDDSVFARDWRPRRETYLTFHSLEPSSDTFIPNAPNSVQTSGISGNLIQSKMTPKVASTQKRGLAVFGSPLDDFVLRKPTTEAELQPYLLGCRLPDTCDSFHDATSLLSDDCELMLLWP